MTAYAPYLTAALRLFLRDPAALSAFDGSTAEARRSFAAALFALPIYALLVLIGPDAVASRRGAFEGALLHVIFYVLIWTVWPVVAVHLTRFVDRREKYPLYLTAYNWSMVVQAGLWFLAFVAILALGFDGSAARIVTVVTICTVVLYHMHVLRTTLGIGTAAAFGLAGFKLILYQILLGTHQVALLQSPPA